MTTAASPKTTLELLRVDFAMACLVRDEKGNVVEEIQVATGKAYPGQFDRFPADLRDVFERAEAQWAQQQSKPQPRSRANTSNGGRAGKRPARKRTPKK